MEIKLARLCQRISGTLISIVEEKNAVHGVKIKLNFISCKTIRKTDVKNFNKFGAQINATIF